MDTNASVTPPEPLPTAALERLQRIHADFVASFATLADLGPAVSVFGSARIKPGHKWYELGQQVAAAIVRRDHAVITGGGPGLMEAANRGAHDAGGHSVGLGISLPFEASLNPYVHTGLVHRYFFVRKLAFLRSCRGLVALPGGYGTLDELFEVLTMMQTNKTHDRPVALAGVEFWSPLLDWIRSQLLDNALVSTDDVDRLLVSDDPDAIAEFVTQPLVHGAQ